MVQTRINRKFVPPKELEVCWMFTHTYRGLRNRVFGATRETHVSQKVVLKMLFAKFLLFKKLLSGLYSPYASRLAMEGTEHKKMLSQNPPFLPCCRYLDSCKAMNALIDETAFA